MSVDSSPNCVECGGTAVVRFGTRTLQRMGLADDGAVVRESEAVQRYRCKECGHAFCLAADDGEVVEAVCDSALRFGIVRAAEHHGIAPGTVSRMLSRWIGGRRDEADDVLPDVLAVYSLRSREPQRLILADAREEGVLDVVDGQHGLRVYAKDLDGAPTFVAIDIEAGIAATVASIWPQAIVVVPPAAAIRAVESAALTTFRALVREGVAKGRNFREQPRLLRVRDEELTSVDRDEISMWSVQLCRFRAAVLLLLNDLAGACPGQFADGLSRVQASLRVLAPDGALDRLLKNWQGAISAGVAERWLDATWTVLETLRREAVATKPSAGLDVLRAILVFSVARESLPTLTPTYGGLPQFGRGRRPLEGAREALRMFSGAERCDCA